MSTPKTDPLESNGSLSMTSSAPVTNRSRFHFQQVWFDRDVREEWESLTQPIRDGRPLRVLEIGSFEGASTTWILDNLLDHPKSTIVAIDTFKGGMEHQAAAGFAETKQPEEAPTNNEVSHANGRAADGNNYQLLTLEERFLSNVKQCRNFNKLRVLKAWSQDALVTLIQEGSAFDFIYIDGSHVALDVLHDAVLSWRLLAVGGTLVFDDYGWKGYNEDVYNPRIAIQAFMSCAAHETEAKETEGQVWLTKVPIKVMPTSNSDAALYYWDLPRWKLAR